MGKTIGSGTAWFVGLLCGIATLLLLISASSPNGFLELYTTMASGTLFLVTLVIVLLAVVALQAGMVEEKKKPILRQKAVCTSDIDCRYCPAYLQGACCGRPTAPPPPPVYTPSPPKPEKEEEKDVPEEEHHKSPGQG